MKFDKFRIPPLDMWSYLTEVRGLKLQIVVDVRADPESYLTEVRGLKLSPVLGVRGSPVVVPHRGTWIEISGMRINEALSCRTSQRYVD